MRGNILYPLNTLKGIFPEVYEQHVKKYKDREILLHRRIERLDCLWNDTLHLSALNPEVVVKELRKFGKDFTLSYFMIPVELLEPERTVVYLNSLRERGTPVPENDYVAYDPNEIEKYSYLPDATVTYFKNTIEKNENPKWFHLVPHILYKGTIDTTNLKINTI